MKYIDGNAIITGRISGMGYAHYLFENQKEFDEHIEEKRNAPGRKYKLWDENPESFPCLMFEIGDMGNPNGADWTLNAFIYDVTVQED